MRTLNHSKWGRNVDATYMVWCYRQTHFPDPHDHSFYELFWVKSGQGQYWINGKIEALKAGDLVLVRPEDTHSFAVAKPGEFLEFVNVAFLSRIWGGLQRRYFPDRPAYFGSPEAASRRHRLNPSQILKLGTLASGLRVGARDRLTIEAFLLGLLSMLEEPSRPPRETEMPSWLGLALEHIGIYPNFAGGTASLARLAGRSPEHVARECRRFLRRKPSDLVNEARMEYASQELQGGDKAIVEIALDCGIENLGHFYLLFRKRHGLTPAQYRRKYHGQATYT